MLQIEQLSITHLQDLRQILTDFSLTLRPGDKAALIGEEGNGKSTLLKLLYDPRLVESYAEYTGRIHFDGRPGYLPQELPSRYRDLSAYDFFAETPAFWSLSPRELGQLSSSLRLPKDIFYSEQRLGSLSGGERVKLQLAKLLIEQPDVLLLDEPSNDLDLEALNWLEGFLLRYPRPVLFISHDETLIERTANVIIHLELICRKTKPRATVARMPYRQYVEERLSKFTHQEQVARKEREQYRQQMEKFRRIQSKVEHQQATISRQDPHGGRLLKKKMHAVQSMGRRFERQKENMTELPEMEEAIFLAFDEAASLPQGKTVLDFSLARLTAGHRCLAENIRLRIDGPQKVGIVGPNGAGKTTLLRQLAAALLPRGDLKAAYMPQNYTDILPLSSTPVEFLNHSGGLEEATKIRGYLGSLKYTTGEMEHTIAQLSGGQQAKLLLLSLVLEGSNVLLLDEPTRNLSPLSGPVIREILRNFGGAIISISHDRKFLSEVCTHIYQLTGHGLERIHLP